MAISIQDVMGAYSPVVEAFDMQKGQSQLADKGEMNANINFDNRIQQEALPITRMLNTDGTVNKENIKSAGRGFRDPYDMWNDIQAQMLKGRSIDPVVFQEKYQMGKQLYDMNLANQLAQMSDSGMSDKERRAAVKENPELYDYALQNNLMSREDSFDWGDTAKNLLIGAAGLGGAVGAEGLGRAALNRIPVKPSLELSRELREKGFRRSGTSGIRKLNDVQVYRDLGIKKDQNITPTKKDGTPDKRRKQKFGLSKENQKKLDDYKKKRNARIKNSKPLQKALGGNKGATGKVLRDVGKHISTKPSFATKAAKFAKKIPRVGGLISLGILGSAAAGSGIAKLLED